MLRKATIGTGEWPLRDMTMCHVMIFCMKGRPRPSSEKEAWRRRYQYHAGGSLCSGCQFVNNAKVLADGLLSSEANSMRLGLGQRRVCYIYII
jgi:hypothetical protein